MDTLSPLVEALPDSVAARAEAWIVRDVAFDRMETEPADLWAWFDGSKCPIYVTDGRGMVLGYVSTNVRGAATWVPAYRIHESSYVHLRETFNRGRHEGFDPALV